MSPRQASLQYSHSMDTLVDIDGVLSGHHLIDGWTPLLFLSFLGWGHLEKVKKQHTCITALAYDI